MAEKISTLEVRQRIGDLLNRVSLRHDEFIIERKGEALAALVPVERLEQMRRFARQYLIESLERQRKGPGNQLSDAQAMDVAVSATRSSRKQPRDKRTRPKRPRR